MSVGKTSDDGTISVLTKDGVTVHKEEDVLITCKGEPNRRERYEWQISNTVGTATRSMATEATEQTTTKVPSASQQRV